MTLILHKGAKQKSLAEIASYPPPEKTRTYTPVSHLELVNRVKEMSAEILKAELVSESYGCNKNGQRFFGVLTYDQGDDEHGLSIGLRNSYDKGISAGFCAGGKVFVCDNLAFSGDSATYARRHTGEHSQLWGDIDHAIRCALSGAEESFRKLTRQMAEMKEIPLSMDAGYDLLGRALWRDKVIGTYAANRAAREWENPSHEEFLPMTVHRLYMALTDAMKLGAPQDAIQRHAKVHSFIEQLLPGGVN